MSQPRASDAPTSAELRRSPGSAENPLVRAVARMPWRVRTKLLLSFAGIVALFVAVGILGLRALGQSDARVERLGTLQLRAAAYREIRTGAAQLRQLLALRAGGGDVNTYVGGDPSTAPTGASLTYLDRTIATTLLQLGPATDLTRLDFVPTPDDKRDLDRIRQDYQRVSTVIEQIIAFDAAGTPAKGERLQHAEAEPLANELGALADELSSATQAETRALIAQNRSAFAHSQRLFVAVGTASIALAVLLGFLLSWSLIGPIQQTEARLAEIASGDFTGHVDVSNRDELGSLAANVNQMSDELERLYDEVTEWNRTLEARVDEQVDEIRASRARVVSAADAERRRIERDLHDGAQQHLIGLIVQLRLARELAYAQPEQARELIAELADDVEATLEQIRDLAHGIYPPLLQDRGLADALAAAAGRAAISARIEANGIARYRPEAEAAVYFCCLEGLQNAAKYAGEGAVATIRVREDSGDLRFEVADDGVGFDGEPSHEGQGLRNMRDRVGAVGGSLQVESTMGRGTTITGLIPLEG